MTSKILEKFTYVSSQIFILKNYINFSIYIEFFFTKLSIAPKISGPEMKDKKHLQVKEDTQWRVYEEQRSHHEYLYQKLLES